MDHPVHTDVLGNVCGRFRRIAGDKIFWRDWIRIVFGDDEPRNRSRFERILDSYLGPSAKNLSIAGKNFRPDGKIDVWHYKSPQEKARFANTFQRIGSGLPIPINGANKVAISAMDVKSNSRMRLSKEDINALASKCPNLVLLRLDALQLTGWPTEHHFWDSLNDLFLSFTNSPNAFKDIELHRIMPNLKYLRIKEDGCPPIMLPDMTQCNKLTSVELIGGGHQSFCYPQSCKERLPFPSGLTKLSINMIEFVHEIGRLDTMEVLTAIKNHSTHCKIQYAFFKDMTTLCSGTL